jgi:hypothetical protein
VDVGVDGGFVDRKNPDVKTRKECSMMSHPRYGLVPKFGALAPKVASKLPCLSQLNVTLKGGYNLPRWIHTDRCKLDTPMRSIDADDPYLDPSNNWGKRMAPAPWKTKSRTAKQGDSIAERSSSSSSSSSSSYASSPSSPLLPKSLMTPTVYPCFQGLGHKTTQFAATYPVEELMTKQHRQTFISIALSVELCFRTGQQMSTRHDPRR